MDFYDLSWQLSDLLKDSDSVYLKTEPEVFDFTSPMPMRATVYGHRGSVSFEVNEQNILCLMGLFDATIFDSEQVNRIYSWNFKSLVTYAYFHLGKFITPKSSLIDLKPIEFFLGIKKKQPENLGEAINRAKVAVKKSGWQKLYKTLHLPLTLRVLPSIETTPLLNERTRNSVYPYYEIEGQTNGRMNCYNIFTRSYLPHTMGEESKSILKPEGYGLRFVTADYRHCEVTVLQWLSHDEVLKEIMESGDDLHRRIYEIITGDVCDTDKKRNFSKLMFLPVMYGCGPYGLSKNLSVEKEVGVELHKRVLRSFPTSVDWLDQQERKAKEGTFTDYFGRPRIFPADKSYHARNTSVQAVAATVCQEKLVSLYHNAGDTARLTFSIHDGYGLICTVAKAKEAYSMIKETLESKSELCSDLSMKVEIKFGSKLNNTKTLWRD